MDDKEKQMVNAMAKDLVDIAFLVKKVVGKGSFNISLFEEVRLLQAMSEEIITHFTKPKAEGKDEAQVE